MSENVTVAQASEQAVSKPRRARIYYLDFIRAFAAIIIVVTHFNNPFIADRPIFVNDPFHIYVGDLGVSLFLIISGASLMYTQGDKEHLDLKSFYIKRAKTLYPMFWIAFVVATTYSLWRNKWVWPQIPKWHLIYSFIGADGLVANMHIPTFYIVGEWFLGFIIVYYAIFPLLRVGVKKHPWVTMGIVVILYCVNLLTGVTFLHLPVNMLMTVRLPELVFGMCFIRYIKTVPHAFGIGSLIFLVLQQWKNFVDGRLAVTTVGIAAFLALVWFTQVIPLDVKPLRVIVEAVSKYSYAIFLTHHIIIIWIFGRVDYAHFGVYKMYGLFALDCLIIAVASVGLFYVEKYVMKGVDYCKKQIKHKTADRV